MKMRAPLLRQAIAQQLMPIYEPLFADTSYGYRPNKGAKDAIPKVKEFAEQGYTFAAVLDLSKYFDTLNHEIMINLLVHVGLWSGDAGVSKRMKQSQGITEQLKSENALEWVGLLNNIRACAMEIVEKEIIYI